MLLGRYTYGEVLYVMGTAYVLDHCSDCRARATLGLSPGRCLLPPAVHLLVLVFTEFCVSTVHRAVHLQVLVALRLLVGVGLVGVLPMYNLMEGEWEAGGCRREGRA